MMQYCQLRLELLGFWIFLNLPNSGFGISSFCKSGCGFTTFGSLNRQKLQKEKYTRNIKKKQKTFSVNKISHGKNVAYTLDILCLLKMDGAPVAV